MNFRRLKQVFKYGWQDAKSISEDPHFNKNRVAVFYDILHCYLKFNVWSNQYKKEKLFFLSGEQRKTICLKYQKKNTKRDKWVKEFFDNYEFLNKWSSFKYERSADLQEKRRNAYKKQYGLGDNCFVGYDVILHKHHYTDGRIVTGRNCLLAEHADIDFTGGISLGNKVSLSAGVKILTHNHVLDFSGINEDKGCILTPLIIEDRVWVGTRAIIMPGVNRIGRGAMVSSNSLVRTEIPPYAIVMGNPGKIIGFRMSPKEIVSFEEANYPENERIPIEELENNYQVFFVKRWRDIKEFTRIKA